VTLGNFCDVSNMTLLVFMSLVGLLVFAGLMVWAAIGDVRSFTITNKLNLVIAGSFLVLALPMGMAWPQILDHVKVGLITIVITIMMFLIGIYGGGDAKMTGAVALWLGPSAMFPFIFYTALAGGVLVIILIISRTIAKKYGLPKSPKWARRMLRKRSAVPYGVALGAGALIAVPQTLWFPASIF
jgi:prepilin peptidase CpaA